MTQTVRVTLAGSDALTETDPDKFALYADDDWVLIKEHSRGVGTDATYGSTTTITHSLGYFPFVMVWGENVAGDLVFGLQTYSFSAYNKWVVQMFVNSFDVTQLIENPSTKDFWYYIFYDQV